MVGFGDGIQTNHSNPERIHDCGLVAQKEITHTYAHDGVQHQGKL
jgi:hypothetical protein